MILLASALDYHVRVVSTLRNVRAKKKTFHNMQFQLIFKTLQSICCHGPIFFEIGPKMSKIYPRFQIYQYILHIIHKNGVIILYLMQCRKLGSKMADLGPK